MISTRDSVSSVGLAKILFKSSRNISASDRKMIADEQRQKKLRKELKRLKQQDRNFGWRYALKSMFSSQPDDHHRGQERVVPIGEDRWSSSSSSATYYVGRRRRPAIDRRNHRKRPSAAAAALTPSDPPASCVRSGVVRNPSILAYSAQGSPSLAVMSSDQFIVHQQSRAPFGLPNMHSDWQLPITAPIRIISPAIVEEPCLSDSSSEHVGSSEAASASTSYDSLGGSEILEIISEADSDCDRHWTEDETDSSSVSPRRASRRKPKHGTSSRGVHFSVEKKDSILQHSSEVHATARSLFKSLDHENALPVTPTSQWNARLHVDEASAPKKVSRRGTIELHGVNGDIFLDPKKHSFNAKDLLAGRCPDCHPEFLEQYLCHEEFKAVFGMSQSEFNCMALWRQQNLKAKLGWTNHNIARRPPAARSTRASCVLNQSYYSPRSVISQYSSDANLEDMRKVRQRSRHQ